MHTSVRSYFIKFNHDFEDTVAHMYLDIKGLVTIGVGNLIDVEKASDTKNLKKVMDELVKLPFVYKEGHLNAGKPASKADIEAEWKKAKGRQEWKNLKEGLREFARLTDLRLKDEAINAMALKKADAMEKELKIDRAFWDFDKWPADAQLGLLSMVWALGAPKIRNGWPNFKTACGKQDFDAAVKHCDINTAGNPGVIPRNTANQRLFKNAAAIVANDGKNLARNTQNRLMLHYPHLMMKPMIIRG